MEKLPLPAQVEQPDRPIPPPPAGLTAEADGQAVQAWLDEKATQVKDQKALNGSDPLRAEIEAIPPARLVDVLAVVDRYNTNWAMRGLLQNALPNMVRYEHRDLVLAQMEAHPVLIAGLLTHGWGPAAAPTLRRMNRRQNLQDALAVPAAKIGMIEALPIAVAQATEEKTGWNGSEERQAAREFLAATFHLPAEEDAITDWLATARPKIHWDETRRVWVRPPANAGLEKVNF